MTLSEIEPATFCLVAQCLDQLRYRVPIKNGIKLSSLLVRARGFRHLRTRYIRQVHTSFSLSVKRLREFTPGRSRRIFRAKKILSTPSFGGEIKPSVSRRSFTACERSQNVTCISAFRQNYRTFLAYSSTFRRWVLSLGDTRGDAWWRKLELLTQIAQ